MPRTAGVSWNVPVEKGIKNAGSRWTARKVEECTSLGYSLLGGISLPKSLPIRFCYGYRYRNLPDGVLSAALTGLEAG